MKDSAIEDYLYWCADRYLSYRPRTEFEIKRYLTQKLKKKEIFDSEEQQQFLDITISKLYEEDRLDDKKFVDLYVEEKQYFKPRGKRRLINELKQKGVAADLIDTRFAEHDIDELPIIIAILQKKFFLQGVSDNVAELLSDQKTRGKITNHLLRRGFSFHNIKLAFEDFIKKK